MGLLANNFRDTTGVYKFYGAGVSNGSYPSIQEANFHRTGATRNLCAGEGVTNQQAGYPYGYRNGGAWSMPQKGGALSSVNESRSSITATGNAAQGLNLVGNSLLTITVNGSAAAVAAAVGSASMSITATGNAVAPFNAVGSATMSLTASADTGAIASITGSSVAAISASLVTGAIGHMVSEPIDQALTVDAIASGVWNASASGNNVSGSMGEKLNDAGSASNPWTEVIESGYTAAEILRLLASVAAGSATGLDAGAAFKSLDGTKDRIQSTITGSNRTTTALDVT